MKQYIADMFFSRYSKLGNIPVWNHSTFRIQIKHHVYIYILLSILLQKSLPFHQQTKKQFPPSPPFPPPPFLDMSIDNSPKHDSFHVFKRA